MPESVLWVAPPSEDGLSVEGDFAPVLMEQDFAAGVAEAPGWWPALRDVKVQLV